jgi:integrase
MARTIRDTDLGTRSSRLELASSAKHGDVYWRRIERGLALGYHKPTKPVGGTWYVRRTVTGQKPVKASIGVADDYGDADGVKVLNFAQAQRKALAWEREQTERPTERGFTVSDALNLWWGDYESRSRSPVAIAEQNHKRRAVENALGSRRVVGLKAEDISTWLAGIVRKGRTVRAKNGKRKELAPGEAADPREVKRKRQATANRLLATLKAALNLAWKADKVSCEPVWKRVDPYKGADQPRGRYLTTAEAIRLVNATSAEFRPLVHAAILTACRWGELRSMRVRDFDAASNTVAVLHAKGGRDRRVPLTGEGVTFFERTTVGRDPAAFMFTRKHGPAWGPQDQKRPMATACKVANVTPAVGFHTLRHTYGSLLAQEGVSMAIIASAMGHADSRMTERHYAHLSPNYVAETIRAKLPAFSKQADSNVASMENARTRRGRTRRPGAKPKSQQLPETAS